MLLQAEPVVEVINDTIVSSDSTTTVAQTVIGNIVETGVVSEQISAISSMPIDQIIQLLTENIVDIALKLLVAVLIMSVGKWIIRRLNKVANKIMTRRNVDASLMTFVSSLVSIGLTILLILTTIGILGIDTTSFVAVFASASLAIGMALSGTLQNFAGGVMILLLKPFKVGDFIEAQGQTGTVKEIQLFNTMINTLDNKAIIIPNGGLSTGIINNYSHEDFRRVDWTLSIAYGDDYDTAKKVIEDLLNADSRVINTEEMPHFIALLELGDSSVNIIVRAWCKAEDYFGVLFDMNENVYKTFGKHGLNIPFPQMDVHVHNK